MRKELFSLFMVGFLVVPLMAQTPQKLAEINKKIVGKWVSGDQKSYIEFRPDGSCSTGFRHVDGRVDISDDKLGWVQGEAWSCGGGILDLIGPNTLTRDFGMGGDPEKFYRESGNHPKPTGALTLVAAQRILIQQIDASKPTNKIYPCRACYDPSDKEDNDMAPLVTIIPTALRQYLTNHGYIRINGEQAVFTAKAKRSRYYEFQDGFAGFRYANFRNPQILVNKIPDPKHVPVGYDLVPTEATVGFFGKVQRVNSIASFSYENGAWSVCIDCGQ